MVKFASWNIRGLNDPLKQREVRSFVKFHALDFICLLETRVRTPNRDRIFSSLFSGWRLFHNYEHAQLGRIWICGNPEKVSIDIIHSLDQAMLCHITVLESNISFWFSAVYASNNYMDRSILWRHLLWCEPLVGQNPWMIMGDFNTTRFSSERSGGNMVNDTAMNDFHECLFSLELADVPFLGPLFTWMNRQAGVNFIARKLDRCLQNESSLDIFPNAFTEVLPPGLSDHCPLVTSLRVNSVPRPRKLIPFKFFNFWADHPDFIGLVKEAWSYEVFGTPMFRLTRKLKSVKATLKAFNFRSFSGLHERVVAARQALCQAQSAVLNSPSNPMLRENEKSCLKNYHDLAVAEEGFLKQKSRVQWLKLGDQNTSFFHKAVKAHNARSALKVITMANGSRTEDPVAIKQEAVRHFQGILCSDEPSASRSEYLNSLDGFRWSPQHIDTLNNAISNEEIKAAIFSIDDSKAPGPDGFSSRFFKAAWGIIGIDVCAAVSSFFESGSMLREINCTVIALVPKVPNPGSMHDYRPISCCNTIYKCISKIIAARIKQCIPDIISPSQSAFVQGRSIADNVLITQDLMLNYHRDIGPPRCALKVDIMKAYDTVSWDCILSILSCMGTPTHLLKCIMSCITTPSFSISINGELAGFFASKRGLRQGDPLSSFLFILAMEAFSRSLAVAANRQGFQFHPRCKEINLTHLCFADDMFLFFGGTHSSVQVFMDELSRFASFSGLQVNKQKSAIFLAGVSDEVRNDLLNATGYSLGRFPMRYLGVPLISTRLTHSDFMPLIQRITARVQSWTSNSLSYAGRLQLIASVLYSIQLYWCSLFIIPKYTISKIEQSLSSFLWSGNSGSARRAKINWESVCLPKEEGGLGLRRVKDLNDSNVMKHIWNLFYKDSLWVAWVRRFYLRQGSLWNAKVPASCSWSLRKILQLRERIRTLIKHKVGDGVATFLWHDLWNPVGPLLPYYGERILYDSAIHCNARVAEVIDERGWNWPIANSGDLIAIKNSCANCHIDASREDIISWTPDPSGVFTVNSAWNHFRPKRPSVNWHYTIWFPQAIRRHTFIVWLAVQKRLVTQDKLLK